MAQWSLTGNSGTTPGTNFLGTTSDVGLMFKANSTQSGYIDIANTNTSFGYASMSSNTSGTTNTVFGHGALTSNTTGSNNLAIGAYALYGNTTSSYNLAVGRQSMTGNTSGAYNSAVGYMGLYSNTTGSYNSTYGFQSLYGNTTGSDNTVSGYTAGFDNTSGAGNTLIGYNTGRGITTGNYNTIIGASVTGLSSSLSNNIILADGQGNQRININSSGYVGIGTASPSSQLHTTGSVLFAGLTLNSSPVRIIVSDSTGHLGYALASTFGGLITASSPSSSSSGSVTSLSTASGNKVVIGNTSVASIGGYANWTDFSDGRSEKNVAENVPGLTFIRLLRPITYTLDIKGLNTLSQGGNDASAIDEAAMAEKEKVVYTGFIPQEVEASAKKANYNFSGVVAPQNDKDLYGLRYADFVVPLVKATQEVDNSVDSLKTLVSTLQSQLSDLQAQINSLKKEVVTTSSKDVPVLLQNAPNPFTTVTTIHYYIPAKARTALLVIGDINGQVLKSVALGARGQGQTSLDGGALANGVYFYSLVVNGKTIDTKKMVLTK